QRRRQPGGARPRRLVEAARRVRRRLERRARFHAAPLRRSGGRGSRLYGARHAPRLAPAARPGGGAAGAESHRPAPRRVVAGRRVRAQRLPQAASEPLVRLPGFIRRSVRGKTAAVVIATTFIALAVNAAALLYYNAVTLRDAQLADVRTLAEIIGRASAPAISFNDSTEATRDLTM